MQLQLSLALCVERLQILFSRLVEDGVGQVDQFGGLAHEFISSVVRGAVLQRVFRVLDVKLQLLLVVRPCEGFAHCAADLYYFDY